MINIMAFTRQLNDPCETKKRIEESTSVLTYLMDSNKYYNCSPCYIEQGVVGGNNVSLYNGNIVDLESDLSGRTRAATRCPSGKYLPTTIVQGRDKRKCNKSTQGLPCGRADLNSQHLVHLPSCKLINYQKRPTSVGYTLDYPQCQQAFTFGRDPKYLGQGQAKPKSVRKNKFSPIEYQVGARY